jgi:hypothetical protein
MRALVELLERWRPGLVDSLEPAGDDDIDELGALAGALPGAYLRFLRTMGASTGAFDPADASFGVADLTAAHAALDSSDSGWASPFLLVGLDPGGRHYFLDRDERHGDDDCMVVRMPLGRASRELRVRLHAGLEEMLYHAAYATLRMPRLAHLRRLARPRGGAVTPAGMAEAACACVEALGFRRIPPATRNALCSTAARRRRRSP